MSLEDKDSTFRLPESSDSLFPASPKRTSSKNGNQKIKSKDQEESLLSLLTYISDVFDTKINSVREGKKVIKAFASNFNSTQLQIRELETENENLSRRKKSPFSSSVVSFSNSGNSKIKKFKNAIEQLQTQLNESEVKLADCQSIIQDQKFQIDTLKLQNTKLQEEIDQLNIQNSSLKPLKQKTDTEDALQIFEDIIKSQTEEIAQLSQQRDELVTKLQKSDLLLAKAENQYKISIKKLDKSEIISSLQDHIDELKSSMSELTNEFIKLVPDDHLKFIPPINRNDDRTNLIELYKYFVNKTMERKEIKSNNYENLLNQLRNTMTFLYQIANSNTTFPVRSESSKSLILNHCSLLKTFINSNYSDIPKDSFSLFDPSTFNDLEYRVSSLLDKLNENSEIISIMIGILGFNHFAITQISLLNFKLREKQQNKYEKDQIEQLEEENRNLNHYKNLIESQIDAIDDIFADKQSIDSENVIELLVEQYKLIKLDNQNLLAENEQLSGELEKIREQSEFGIQNLKSEFKEIKKELIDERNNHEAEINCLKARIVELEAENTNIKTNNESIINELKNKYESKKQKLNQIVAARKETDQIVAQISEKVEILTADNQTLNQTNIELSKALKIANEENKRSQEIIKKLSNSREKLKNRLEEAEAQNKNVLSEIKRRNHELTKKYDSEVTTLHQELKEAREEAAKSKILMQQKQELQTELTNVRISERFLKIKNTILQEQFDKLNSTKGAYYSALSSQSENYKKQLETIKNEILGFLDEENYNISIGEVVTKLQGHFNSYKEDKFIVTDAKMTRASLQLGKTVSLKNVFESKKKMLNEANARILKLEKELEDIKNEFADKQTVN